MHFIKDIFEKNKTEHAHCKFIRYSKGDFLGPLMKIKISKSEIKIGASFHYADELMMLLAQFLGHKIVHINGTLVWNQDLTEGLAKLGIKYSKVIKSRGIFKYTLDNDVDITDFVDSMIKYNILASIKYEEYSYVTKNSFPKPNKEFGPDFVKVIFPPNFKKRILEEFAFDAQIEPKKSVIISHRILIDDIILPKDTSDFDRARREAKRKGKLTRTIKIDRKDEINTEININV